ncbi:MAG: peptidylprolyl isomerase [Firmicutes bacterium]|nr:peptidylprolyl isomerase [Bacillota bacterium]
MNKSTWLLGVILVVVMVLLAGCSSNVVATVNGEKITRDSLDKKVDQVKANFEQQGAKFTGSQGQKMLEALRQQTLDQMIQETLILQQARKEGVLPTDKEIQDKIALIKKSFSGDQFKKLLDQYKMTENDLKDLVLVQFAQQNLMNKVAKDVKVTEDDARKYYEQNKSQFDQPEKLQVRQILIAVNDGSNPHAGAKRNDAEARAEAEKLIKELRSGKDFAALAKEKSDDPGTKANGGLYVFARGEAVPEFEQAAFALKPGQITEKPVKTKYGYHIIKLEKIIPAKTSTFDEVKGELVAQLTTQAKEEKFGQYLADVKKNAKITNNLAKSTK